MKGVVQRKTWKHNVSIKVHRRAGKQGCAICVKPLGGVPRLKLKKSKTQKRPERRFGGVLCGNCCTQIIKEKMRLGSGNISESEVDFRQLPYLRRLKI